MTTRAGGSYSYNVICDVCGFKFKNNQLRKRWDGLYVCKDDWEARHPLDFYRPRNDHHKLPYIRPDSSRTETTTVMGYPYTITVSSVSGTGNNGISFTTTVNGTIKGCAFWIGSSSGDQTGWYTTPMQITLWQSGGSNLTTETFIGPFLKGWNQRNFRTPVAITTGNTYRISRMRTSSHGFYVAGIPSLSAQPHLTYVNSVFNVSGTLSEPTTVDAVNLNLVDAVFDPD
jgi:hypothetical protein